MYLAKNKLDCIEMLISNSIKDGLINHDKFLEVLKEKKEYDSSCNITVVFITAEAYKNAGVHIIKDNKTNYYFWVKIVDAQKGLGLKCMRSLIRREICGIYETDNLTK